MFKSLLRPSAKLSAHNSIPLRPSGRPSICVPPAALATSLPSPTRSPAQCSMDFLDHAMGQAMSSMDELLTSSDDLLSSPQRSNSSSSAAAMAIPFPTSTTEESAPSTSGSAAPVDNLELLLQRWTRRLLTKRDYMHAHAASNVAFLLGGLALELITNAQWLAGDRLQPWYPTHGFEMAAMQAVIAVSAATGLGLTFSNRHGAERTVFAAYGLQVLQGVMLMLWMSPFLPQALRDCSASDVGFGAFSIISSIMALQQLYEGKDEIMAGRNKKNAASSSSSASAPPAPGSLEAMAQELSYWFPNLPGPIFTALAGVMQVHGGREWCDAFSAAHPEYLACTLHIVLATTLAGHCGMFAVTLRDKKLIGQEAEMAIAGVTNIASLAYIALLWVEYPWLLTHALLV